MRGYQFYNPGLPKRDSAKPIGHSAFVFILPFIKDGSLYNAAKPAEAVRRHAGTTATPRFQRPSISIR